MEKAITLYRPTGAAERQLVARSGWRRFPPRLTGQPIFYPVLQRDYAAKIASKWNARYEGSGFVLRFSVRADYLDRFVRRSVGGKNHIEYWIPAEELDEFNDNIVGTIETIDSFRSSASDECP
jgi:hypothetical protein